MQAKSGLSRGGKGKRVTIVLVMAALVAALAGCVAIEYDVTFSSSDGGTVTVPGEGTFTYVFCTEVSLVATPDDGYRFVGWTGDVQAVVDVGSPSTIITSVQGDYAIRANFEPIPAGKFGLTTSSTAGGSVTVPGEGTFLYDEGTVVSLIAAPADGYHFVSWTGDVDSIADVDLPSTTITMDGDYSVRANFEELPAGKLALTTSSTAGGSVTAPGEGMFLYDEGAMVDLVAVVADGYYFVKWTGDVDSIADVDLPSTTITMEGNYSVRANFEEIPAGKLALTTSSTAGGSVTAPGEGTFIYDEGTVVDLVATADSGYRFAGWTGDVGTVADVNLSSTAITMDGNYSLRADFEAISPGVVVGLTGHRVDKLSVMAPWILLAAVMLGGGRLLVLKRRRA